MYKQTTEFKGHDTADFQVGQGPFWERAATVPSKIPLIFKEIANPKVYPFRGPVN